MWLCTTVRTKYDKNLTFSQIPLQKEYVSDMLFIEYSM